MFKTMYGTTNAIFTVVTGNAAGRVGYRDIGSNQFRVRVEPTQGTLPLGSGWSTPSSDQKRYSKVVNGTDGLVQALAAAQTALTSAAVSIQ